MLVVDLDHFVDLPADAPISDRRLAIFLGRVVRAATAGDVAVRWTTSLPCAGRPGRWACHGRVAVERPEPAGLLYWSCSICGAEGSISNWEGSPYDLRRRRLAVVGVTRQVVVTNGVADVLQTLPMLDAELARLVFAMHAHPDGAVLSASLQALERLVAIVAVEVSQEIDLPRQLYLDDAYDVLSAAAAAAAAAAATEG